MLAMDDSASIFCARLMRGTMSMASTVMSLAFIFSSCSSLEAGQTKPIRILPSGAASISCAVGSRTLTITSAFFQSSAAEDTISTPAAR